MANYIYEISELDPTTLSSVKELSEKDRELLDSIEIKSYFNSTQANVKLDFISLDDDIIATERYYKDYTVLGSGETATQKGATNINIDPEADIKKYGFEGGDVRLLYSFTNNLFSNSQAGGEFFIESISSDRTEIRALAVNLTDEQVQTYSTEVINAFESSKYFSEFKVAFSDNADLLGVNFTTERIPKGLAIVVKLYEPAPTGITKKSVFTVNEIVSDDILLEVKSILIRDEIKVPYIKGPNFNVELAEKNSNTTEFLNFNELFSYPVSNSYFELNSLFNEKSAQIAIDHTDFKDFIHFSSIEERLRNFKYKFELIESYEALKELKTSFTSSLYEAGVSGSVEHYDKLITGIVNNFDHYDRFLYYESSSWAWPKSTKRKPYLNTPSTDPVSEAWFGNIIQSASNFDNSNFDILTNTIPTFIREDSNNEPYLMFIHMIAQHFDNLWVYFKAVSDKYDTDHRMNFGVSKDIVRSAVESFGINLYNSNQNIDNLFATFIGQSPDTGSEIITTMSIATSPLYNSGSTELEYLQPVAKLDYEKEIYKRIYHNLPYLTKTKGTERGLRALINCFGVTPEILSIKGFGGVELESARYFGPEYYTTSSSETKIRLDNTGSEVLGDTLSKYTSIVKEDKKYTDDLHHIEIGFNISRGTDEFIDLKTSGSFDIDDNIGDPRNRYERDYPRLKKTAVDIVNGGYFWEDIVTEWQEANWRWDDQLEYARSPKSFVRLLNFFDSSLFKVIKDFVPARSKVDTGVIIKGHKLARNKVKQVEVSLTEEVNSGSIKVGSITGSQGGSFDRSGALGFTTNYQRTFETPLGPARYDVVAEVPQYTGEFSGSLIIGTDGEVGKNNPFINLSQPQLTFDITVFNLSLPLPPACVIALTSTFVGEYYEFATSGSGQGTVTLTYPEILGGESSFTYTHDFNDYPFFSVTAEGVYGYYGSFLGWYDSDDILITTSSVLTIYKVDEDDLEGFKYYAKFL